MDILIKLIINSWQQIGITIVIWFIILYIMWLLIRQRIDEKCLHLKEYTDSVIKEKTEIRNNFCEKRKMEMERSQDNIKTDLKELFVDLKDDIRYQLDQFRQNMEQYWKKD